MWISGLNGEIHFFSTNPRSFQQEIRELFSPRVTLDTYDGVLNKFILVRFVKNPIMSPEC